MALELKIGAVNTFPISLNYEELKRELAAKVEPYKGLIVTEDAIPTAKADLANIRRLMKALDDRRKEVKKEYEAPLKDFEAQIKDIISVANEAADNIDGQIKAFENTFQKLPFDICAGLTWKPAHAPLRFTLSCDNLTRWSAQDFYFAQDDEKSFSEILKRHISLGADINLTDRFYVAMGCNMRTRAEMAGKGSKGFTGMTLGTGIRLGRVMFDVSYGKYQVSESSLICNFAFNI